MRPVGSLRRVGPGTAIWRIGCDMPRARLPTRREARREPVGGDYSGKATPWALASEGSFHDRRNRCAKLGRLPFTHSNTA